MPLNSFLTFFSLSSRINHLDEETDREFFSWLKDEFIRFRPGYMYQPTEINELHEKYRLLIGNLRIHGRVLEPQAKKQYKNDDQEISALPEKLFPHIYFSESNPSSTSDNLKTARISEIRSTSQKTLEFGSLSMRYGLKIKKQQLYEKIALIGKAAHAASEYVGNSLKISVEIYDPYFCPAFLRKLLAEKIEYSKYLSFKIHFCDLWVCKDIKQSNTMTGLTLKTACQKRVKDILKNKWYLIEGEIERIDPRLTMYWRSGKNLRLYHWQPKEADVSTRRYVAIIKNSFHRRLICIDKRYHLKSDHSFHLPEKVGTFDEDVGFSLEQPDEFVNWADKREFEAQRLLVNGMPSTNPD